MQLVRDPDRLLLRLDRGEDVLASITGVVREHDLPHCVVQGIGAIESIEIGAYELDRRVYRRHHLDGGWEVLSLSGNVGWADGQPMPHLHVVLGDLDGHLRGGHLFAGTVHVTLELTLWPGQHRLQRGLDREVGLPLWQLPSS